MLGPITYDDLATGGVGWFVLAIACWLALLVGAVGLFGLVEAVFTRRMR